MTGSSLPRAFQLAAGLIKRRGKGSKYQPHTGQRELQKHRADDWQERHDAAIRGYLMRMQSLSLYQGGDDDQY